MKRNAHVAKLHAGYLFPEIIKRQQLFAKTNPHVSLIQLGIGDTTEPLSHSVAHKMSQTAQALSTLEGYSGYGPEEGNDLLRQLIKEKIYGSRVEKDEVLISDGSNCDIGRLQILFGSQATLAVQDPSYPVYVDTGVMMGQTSSYHSTLKQYGGVTYLPCSPSNQFFPLLGRAPPTDLIYFCSPNNPTGHAATYDQLQTLVDFALAHRSIIIYDTAYAAYIRESDVPLTIYDIPKARQVAIELGSFSKMSGFTGVRLGWSIVPKELTFDDGHSVHQDWNRVHATFFNGASNIAQAGGMAVLQSDYLKEIRPFTQIYMDNAAILRDAFKELNYTVYGGLNAPYLWVEFPHFTSWQAFDMLLEKAHVVTAPGSGFGPGGEGFLRISAFGSRASILEAANRLRACLVPICFSIKD